MQIAERCGHVKNAFLPPLNGRENLRSAVHDNELRKGDRGFEGDGLERTWPISYNAAS